VFAHLALIEDASGFTPLDDATPGDILSAQVETQQWLEEMGVRPDSVLVDEVEKKAARAAFQAITFADPNEEQRGKLVQIKTPAAVQHLVGMLSAYDWEFIERAKEIRGYCVAQLLEETKDKSSSIRLKALGLLGKVTEIGLFTDKIEIKKIEMTDQDIEARIKEKLNRFMQVIDVADARNVMDAKDVIDDIDDTTEEIHK